MFETTCVTLFQNVSIYIFEREKQRRRGRERAIGRTSVPIHNNSRIVCISTQ